MKVIEIRENQTIPIYKIHGIKRRQLKKELAQLKRFVKTFWYYRQLDKDMYSFLNCNTDSMLSDELAKKRFESANNKIKSIEKRLSIPYQ